MAEEPLASSNEKHKVKRTVKHVDKRIAIQYNKLTTINNGWNKIMFPYDSFVANNSVISRLKRLKQEPNMSSLDDKSLYSLQPL